MSDRILIKCIISSSVSIDDLGVHLAGVGSTSTVFTASASASKDLKNAIRNKWVVLQQLGEDVKIWPLSGFKETSKTPIILSESHQDSSIIRLLGNINDNLKELLGRPISPAPEVLAAHVRSLSSMPVIPPGLPGGGSLPGTGSSQGTSSHPQFIPSQIIPDVNIDDIHVTEETSNRGIDASVDALRKARRKS